MNLKEIGAFELLELFSKKVIAYHKYGIQNNIDVVWREILDRLEDGARAKKAMEEIIRVRTERLELPTCQQKM
jgi:hypothetical protein